MLAGKHNIINFMYLMGGSLFVLMMYTPRANQGIKLMFLGPLLVLILGGMKFGMFRRTNIIVEIWFIFTILFGALWCLIGYLNGYPGAGDYARLYIIWMILYYILQRPLSGLNGSRFLYRCSRISLILICFFHIISILHFIELFPTSFITQVDMGMKVGIQEGYIILTAHNVGSLMYLVPMIFSVSLNQDLLSPSEKYLNGFLLSTSIIVVYLTGRRALLFVVMLSPILSWIVWRFVNRDVSKLVWRRVGHSYLYLITSGVLIMFILYNYTTWEAESFTSRITDVFTDDGGARLNQGKYLIDGFLKRPIWGHGFGSYVHEVIRDAQKPWQYELSYHLLLHNLGLVGFTFWAALVSLPIIISIKLLKMNQELQNVVVPLVVGEIAFLIANATNPYLVSFDFMFILFVTFPALKTKMGTPW